MALIKIKQIDNLQTELNDLSTDISTGVSEAKSYADSLDADQSTDILNGVSEAKSYADSLDADQSTDIVNGVSEAKSYADSLDAVMDGRVDTLEAAIIEDDEFVVETKTGNGLGYALTSAVQDDEVELVWAYVNGVSVEVAAVTGTAVELVDPGYAIDAGDRVKFHYQTV